MLDLATLETKYQAAKARLLNAQQEKMEAAAEFVSARTALGEALEDLWPARKTAFCECVPEPGYHETAYGRHQTR